MELMDLQNKLDLMDQRNRNNSKLMVPILNSNLTAQVIITVNNHINSSSLGSRN
jgi:hypothetical protein